MILLPAIDIRDGRAVRLVQGDFARETVYADSPLEAARGWAEAGAEALHVVDLDGARRGEPASLGHLREIAGELGLPVQYGGGLRTLEAVRDAFAAGADRVVVGTAAYRERGLLESAVAEYADRVLVAVDVRGGRVAVAGWAEGTGLAPAEAIADLRGRGAGGFVFTDVERDGMLDGPDLGAVRAAAAAVGDGRLVYSGGVGALEHLEALRRLRLPSLTGVISGKALYERRFTIEQAKLALA